MGKTKGSYTMKNVIDSWCDFFISFYPKDHLVLIIMRACVYFTCGHFDFGYEFADMHGPQTWLWELG